MRRALKAAASVCLSYIAIARNDESLDGASVERRPTEGAELAMKVALQYWREARRPPWGYKANVSEK